MRCRAAFRLFDQDLIFKSVCPKGELGVGARTNPLRKDFRTTHGLELLAEVGNRIHFQHWNGGPDGIVRLLLQDVDQDLSIFANDREVLDRSQCLREALRISIFLRAIVANQAGCNR